MFKGLSRGVYALVFVVIYCILGIVFDNGELKINKHGKNEMSVNLEDIDLSELNDAEIVVRMRQCNYEKYKTLVRMHLSFELDLNTDEFDLPCHEIVYEDKGKLKKWNRFSKKHKHAGSSHGVGCGATAKSAGNSPTDGLSQQIDAGFMFHLKELKEFLMLEKNLKQEGIYRKTGSNSRQNELRLHIQNEKPLNLNQNDYSAHDCATVFKSYLAELTEPLLTDAHYPAHLQIAPLCIGMSFNSSNSTLTRPPNPERVKREQRLLNSMQLLLLLLPEENRSLLAHIVDMLNAVTNFEHINKMTAENLATLFAPHLICPRGLPPEALHYISKKMSTIIAYMVTKGVQIFEVPAKLSTDIRAYFLERKRKKTMSPEQTLDDSISDISTVNTVYTFVDRERTAAAHTTNTTDTELAQLYAHIQTLPESSKKRRLIKQFNKQNGQGTPLQLVIMNRLKNSDATRSAKSFGDSIKKHIFHKGIMSRTPKRTGASIPVGIETPNFSNHKQPKLRVLFQSPTPSACASTTTLITPEPIRKITTKTTANHAHLAANNTTPYMLKTHPLQKSISSSSLLLNSSNHSTRIYQHNKTKSTTNTNTKKAQNDDIECSSSCSSLTNSNDAHQQQQQQQQQQHHQLDYSVSAPVSRQTSRDLQTHTMKMNLLNASNSSNASLSSTSTNSSQHFQLLDPNCCVTPLKLISEAAKQLISNSNMVAIGGGGGGGGSSNSNSNGGVSVDKKTVAWDEEHLIQIDEDSSTSLQSSQELKSRYKSEPNLSRIIKDKQQQQQHQHQLDIPETVFEKKQQIRTEKMSTVEMRSKSLTRKLIKGVSMGNLKFPFATPESTKRLVRTVSSTLKRRHSDDSQTGTGNGTTSSVTRNSTRYKITHPHIIERNLHAQLEDLDDETFEDDPNDHCDTDIDTENEDDTETETDIDDVDGDGDGEGVDENHGDNDNDTDNENVTLEKVLNAENSSSGSGPLQPAQLNGEMNVYEQILVQPSGLYRNIDLITSTPAALLLGRRSMSPITKSAQRMPKSMQESIMTPRSRKPVMVFTTTLGSSDPNQTIYQTDLSSFREQDEDNENSCTQTPDLHSEDANSVGCFKDLIQNQRRQLTKPCKLHEKIETQKEALTHNFKEYLRSRSVFTDSPPVDSSFSSQPDDFGGDDDLDDNEHDESDNNNDDFENNSTREIVQLNDSQLSPNLLYCLDGNGPPMATTLDEDDETHSSDTSNENYGTPPSHLLGVRKQRISRRDHLFGVVNNARKRAATSETTKKSTSSSTSTNTGKENQNQNKNKNVDDYLLTKKIVIGDFPNETSF